MGKKTKEQDDKNFVKFGFEKISTKSKRNKVSDLFDSISSDYDKMNDIMSLGSHRFWKKDLVERIEFFKSQKKKKSVLDLAGGTGDIAFLIKNIWPKNNITVFDLSKQMIDIGILKSKNKGFTDNPQWISGDSAHLPFKNSTFDIITCAFGIRNVAEVDHTLSECYRVLRPGGKILILEFSPVAIEPLNKIYNFYLKNVIPEIGRKVAKDKRAYQYLCDSILTFYKPKEFTKILEKSGFQKIKTIKYFLGIAYLYIAFHI